MTDRLARWMFHAVTVRTARPPTYSSEASEEAFLRGLESTRRFFSRFRGHLDVRGKSVLDVGCGTGTTCIEAASRGATHVTGVDIQPQDWSRENLLRRHAEIADTVEFVSTDGSLRELGDQQFDLVISQDSFEHYRDPEAFISIIERFIAPGGVLAIGFGPLWKAPTGGHIYFMTKLPWAHLLFPEHIIMAERRRFRPAEDAQSFEEIRGGLNKMTLARFEWIMHGTDLRQRYFATNVSDNPIVGAMDVISRIPPLREYFTANVYSVWEKNSPR